MKTLREQIANKCVHFTGIGSVSCNAGIKYSDVREKEIRFYKFPCLKDSELTGGWCGKVKFPENNEVDKQVKGIEEMGKMSIIARNDIRNKITLTNEKTGNVICPACNGILYYNQSTENGHIWANCICGFGWME
jgi:hypothetical protein